MGGSALQMRRLLGKLGSQQQPHWRWVITWTRERTECGAWQSSDNSGLIHHRSIMLLTGTEPKEILDQASLRSQNNPIPLQNTHTASGCEKEEQMSESYKNLSPTAEETHVCLE